MHQVLIETVRLVKLFFQQGDEFVLAGDRVGVRLRIYGGFPWREVRAEHVPFALEEPVKVYIFKCKYYFFQQVIRRLGLPPFDDVERHSRINAQFFSKGIIIEPEYLDKLAQPLVDRHSKPRLRTGQKNFYAAALAIIAGCAAFIGCKDYDSDIRNLQEQIDVNKDAIAALQQAIAKGSTITGVTPGADGYKITFSDGTSIDLTNGKDGKDGQQGLVGPQGPVGEPGKDAPVPQLRVNDAKNWEMSTDGGTTWAELKDAAGNSIADAKTYVADYVKIDENGYIVIGDKTTAFRYDVSIPSVTEDASNKVAIITVPATETEPMKTLRVPMEGYFDQASITSIVPVKGKTELTISKTTVQSETTIGDKTYAAGDVVYTGAGIPVVLNPAQVNASAVPFSFVASDRDGSVTLPLELTLTAGSAEDISVTKAAPASGLWTLTAVPTDPDFPGFSHVALSAQNSNGTSTLSAYEFEITIADASTAASGMPSTAQANTGASAVIAAAANIIDSYAAFDDGTQEKDGYGIRRADADAAADAPYTGDWEVYELPAAALSKAAVPEKSLTVVYSYIGEDGNAGSQNVTVDFFAPIMAPEVSEVTLEPAVSAAAAATELSLTQDKLLAALFPNATVSKLEGWKEAAKNFTLAIQSDLVDADVANTAKFYLSSADKGANVADAAAFDEIKISLVNKTEAGTYYATLSYEDQVGKTTEVKIGFTVTSPVTAVEGPTGKEIANDVSVVEVAVADFTAKDADQGTVTGGIAKVVAAVSADTRKITVEVPQDGQKIVCTRVGDAPTEAGVVEVTATVQDPWGVEHSVTFEVALLAAAEVI